MKKYFLLGIMIFVSNMILNAQNNMTVLYSVKYNVNYMRDNVRIIEDICQLNITEKSSYFFSIGKEIRLQKIREKFEKNGQNGGPINFKKGELRSNYLNFTVLKKYENKKAIFIEDIGGQNLGFVKDTLSSNRWIITNEKETFNGLICNKATMKRDTVLITAWFTTKIPLQEGPLYFYGLPGLIIKAKTNTGFEIELVSTENKILKKEQLKIPNYLLVSEKQVNRAKANYDAAFKSGRLPNGDIVTPKNF